MSVYYIATCYIGMVYKEAGIGYNMSKSGKIVDSEKGESGMEITWNQVKAMEKSSYVLVDIRKYEASNLGKVPSAIAVSYEEEPELFAILPKDKKILIYCNQGNKSLQVQKELSDKGYDAYSIKGGYSAFLKEL